MGFKRLKALLKRSQNKDRHASPLIEPGPACQNSTDHSSSRPLDSANNASHTPTTAPTVPRDAPDATIIPSHASNAIIAGPSGTEADRPNILAIPCEASKPKNPTTNISQVLISPIEAAEPSSSSTWTSKHPVSSLQERLLVVAYDALKSGEPKIVDAYEKLLSVKVKDIDSDPTDEDQNRIAAFTQDEWSRMRQMIEDGLKKRERSAAVYKKINDAIQFATPMKPVISQAVQASPPAAAAWVGVTLALEIIVNPFKESNSNADGITYVVSRMEWYWSLMGLLDTTAPDAHIALRCKIENQFSNLYQKLLSYQMKSICRYFRNRCATFCRDLGKWDDWDSKLDAIKNSETALMEDLKTYNDQVVIESSNEMLGFLQNIDVSTKSMDMSLQCVTSAIQCLVSKMEKIQEDEHSQRCLNDLFQTDPKKDRLRIIGGRDGKHGLIEASYGWILDLPDFRRWQTNPESRRLWIRGDPGKGKTMLLCGIIERLEKSEMERLCYFFCQATVPALNNATSVLRGLVYQLVRNYPWLLKLVLAVYDNGGKVRFEDHNAWETMSELLVSMLSDPCLDGVLLIVDALDECVTDRPKLLGFIERMSNVSRAKIIVSSRKWAEIDDELGDNHDNASTITLELHDGLISKAVQSYIERKVAELADRKRLNGKTCTKIEAYLRKESHDTFLWVALVCQELFERGVKEHNVMKVVRTFPPGLDALYTRMMNSIPPVDAGLFQETLGVVSVLKRPVTAEELFPLIQSSFDGGMEFLEQAITSWGSFFTVQEGRIYFVHQSAVDFLQSKASKLPSIANRHQHVFSRSLDFLIKSRNLKRDIYDLKAPHLSYAEIILPQPDPLSALQYCCIYWVDHLVNWAGMSTTSPLLNNPDAISKIYNLLQGRFLYWVEALALLRHMPQAVQAIQNLQILVDGKGSQAEQDLSDFLHDANRFLLHHRVVVQEFPLQLYVSALVFSPRQSTVKNSFRDEAPEWATAILGVDTTWNSCLQTLEDHTSGVTTVAYSPNGKWLVSGDKDGFVKLWNADDGTCIRTLCGNFDYPDIGECCSAVFSSDSNFFIARWSSGTVSVWDRATGNCTRKLQVRPFIKEDLPYGDTTSGAVAIGFSLDSCVVACAVEEKEIVVQEIGAKTRSRTLEGIESPVTWAALSTNGQWLASKSGSKIRVWNTFTGEWKETTDDISSGKTIMSDDGKWLAVSARILKEEDNPEIWEETVQIWELETTKLIWKLHVEQQAGVMAFSGRKELLAASSNEHIWVWSTKTGTLTGKVGRHASITSISFSPDTQQIISASRDSTIRAWDTPKANQEISDNTDLWDMDRRIHYNHEDQLAVHFSGAQNTIVWDKETRYDLAMAENHHGHVSTITLSEDKQRLALGFTHGEITIWNTKSGSYVRTLHEKAESCYNEDCSGENNSSGKDSEHKNCDKRMSSHSHPGGSGEGPEGEVPSLVPSLLVYEVPPQRTAEISPLAFRGNAQLASNAYGNLNVWNTIDGTCIHPLECQNEWITLMIFSKDGQWLAYMCGVFHENLGNRRMIKVWDMATKRCTLTSPEVPAGRIETISMSFSADSRQLAISTYWGITLWDVRSGACIQKLENYHYGFVRILFDVKHEKRLHTQYGFIDCNGRKRDYLGPIDPNPNSSISDNSETDLQKAPASDILLEGYLWGYGFSRDLQWIMLDGKKVLRIPTEYRPSAEHHLYAAAPVINGRSLMWITKVGRLVRVNFTERD